MNLEPARARRRRTMTTSCSRRFIPGVDPDVEAGRAWVATAPVRIQWDPERNLRGDTLEHRSIQFDLGGPWPPSTPPSESPASSTLRSAALGAGPREVAGGHGSPSASSRCTNLYSVMTGLGSDRPRGQYVQRAQLALRGAETGKTGWAPASAWPRRYSHRGQGERRSCRDLLRSARVGTGTKGVL
jgi:hypothetical protein